ncbi:MAG: serine protein kinase RIO [Thermoplasmatota archaeon]
MPRIPHGGNLHGELPEEWAVTLEHRLGGVLGRPGEKDAGDRKTVDEVFDRSTLLAIYKLISNGVLDTIDYPLSTGKEANVFHATGKDGPVAVKIFRTNTATFRSLMTYIEGDPRFTHIGPRFRDVIFAWTQKEYKNLQRLAEASVTVPVPIAVHENVIVMQFIGEGGTPAPLLKDKPPADPSAAWISTVEQYRRILQVAGLVHGDLSEYNILNDGGNLVIIDVAQAVLVAHPMAREFLERDARNLSRWFTKVGAKEATAASFLKAVGPLETARTRGVGKA